MEKLKKNRILYWLGTIRDKLISIHNQIKQTKESDLLKHEDRNPYQMLFDWFLDIVQFGFPIAFVVYSFSTQNWILLPFAFGILRWLSLDTIGSITKQIKGN